MSKNDDISSMQENVDKEIEYTQSAICDEIKNVLVLPKWNEIIRHLQPNDTFLLDVSKPEWCDLFLNVKEQRFHMGCKRAILEILQVQYVGIDIVKEFDSINIEFTVDDEIDLHDISPKHSNRPVRFDCDVIATDNRKTYILSAWIKCPKCSVGWNQGCAFDKTFPDQYCITPDCHKAKLMVDKATAVTDYVQTIVIQEPLEVAVHNSPVMFTGKVYGHQIGTVFPGQKKRMTGIFRNVPDKKSEEMNIIIEVASMVDLEEQEVIFPDDNKLKLYRQQILDGNFCSSLIDSFAPEVYANNLYRDIKLSILLQLASGTGTHTKRGDINQLLVGDPSMAKSVLLKAAQRVVQKSIFTSGRGASAAGLTIGIVKLSDGRAVAQAGVMPLCSGGFAMIDEFDKMNGDDRTAMHEAMEQQQVSIAKAGIVMTLPAKTSVLSAANPKYGKYDNDLSLTENINLPVPLLSRMDMIWLIVDVVDKDLDSAKAHHILRNFRDEESQQDQPLSEKELMAYLNYARAKTPILADSVEDYIVELYNNMRSSAKDGMAIGTRQLEALVRMSTAHAKLLLKAEVDLDDVKIVTDLLKTSYMTLGVNLDTGDGKHQANFDHILPKDEKDQVFWKVFNKCVDEVGEVSEEEVIAKCAEYKQFGDDSKSRRYFGQMERQNKLLQKGNKYKRA